MSASSPVPKDHPLMVAWEAYKATEDYANTKRWAGRDDQATDGSLWASFERGWLAAGGRPPFDREPPAPPDDLRNALVKVRMHTSYHEPGDPDLLRGLLASVERIVDAALAAPAPVAAPAPETPAPDAMPEKGWAEKMRAETAAWAGSCEGCPYPDTCNWYSRCTFRRRQEAHS